MNKLKRYSITEVAIIMLFALLFSTCYTDPNNRNDNRNGTCIVCGGSGRCYVCRGRGFIKVGDRCYACNGSGKCFNCNGTGKVITLNFRENILLLSEE